MSASQFLRPVRLASGLVLMTFVLMHLINLAIGLQSLDAMEAWRARLMGPWQGPLGQWLLNGSALLHAGLGLWSVAARRSLVMSRTDGAQLLLGLLTPVLLVNHVLTLRLTYALNGEFEPSYGLLLAVFWSFAPVYAFQQLFVVVVVWVHAALGLHSWMVLKSWWPKAGGFVLPVLFAVPILALLGFVESGKEAVARIETRGEWMQVISANAGRIAIAGADIARIQQQILLVYAGLTLLALAVLAWRILSNRERVVVRYDGGLSAKGRRGLSVLELSRQNHIPHAHVCSGRGRCGTCRVRVVRGADALSPRSPLEAETLERGGAAAEVRLACQALVLAPGLEVERLLPAFADASAARQPKDWLQTGAAGEPVS